MFKHIFYEKNVEVLRVKKQFKVLKSESKITNTPFQN